MITTMLARQYYGKHATGKVVLWNNIPVYHASCKEVNQFLKEIRYE